MHSTYESVQEQTGIFAGKGGFDVTAGEHIQLKGAVISPAADGRLNRLETGTLGFGDIVNHADYRAEHQSAGISIGGQVTGNVAAAISGASAPYLAELIHNQTLNADGTVNVQANLIAHAALGAAVAQAQGNSALRGASGGTVGEYIAQQLYPALSIPPHRVISLLLFPPQNSPKNWSCCVSDRFPPFI